MMRFLRAGVMFFVFGGLVFGIISRDAQAQEKEKDLKQEDISRDDWEIIRELDFLEELPFFSEEDYSMFEEDQNSGNSQK